MLIVLLLLLGLLIEIGKVNGDLFINEDRIQMEADVDLNFDEIKLLEKRSQTFISTAKLELVFAVSLQNVVALEDQLSSVSSPNSNQHGKHLSLDQTLQLVAPSGVVLFCFVFVLFLFFVFCLLFFVFFLDFIIY